MDLPLEKVLELSVYFSFISSRAIFRIHTRSRLLVAHAKSGTCTHQRMLTLRLNFLGLTSYAVSACFELRYGKTIKVISRQNIIKNLRNGKQ